VTYTAGSGNGSTCPAASDLNSTSTYPPPADAGGAGDGGLPAGCTCGSSGLSCTITESTTTEMITATYTATGYSGTLSIQTGDAAACTYTFTATM
jgi:hypothetical protein